MPIENLLFAFVLGFGVLLVVLSFSMPRTTGNTIITDAAGRPRVASIAEAAVLQNILADLSQRIRPADGSLAERIRRSGYVYANEAEFHARRMATALILMAFLVFISVLIGLDFFPAAILATGGAVFGFTDPDRRLTKAINDRRKQILREMGFGLDRIALLLGADATLAEALSNASGIGLFGNTCAYISTGMQTSKPINEIIDNVRRTLPVTPQLDSFLELLRVGMVQGQELTEPFKQMALMMRQRLKLEIVEAGQRARIQVTVITSGFIVVATLIVAVGPTIQMLMGSGLF